MISDDYSNLPIAVYEQGTFFGDIEVFKNIKRYFSTIALTNLELYTIEKNKFKKIFFRDFPFLGHIFLTHFDQKWNKLQEIIELIQDFFESKKIQDKKSIQTTLTIKENKSQVSKKSSITFYLLFTNRYKKQSSKSNKF